MTSKLNDPSVRTAILYFSCAVCLLVASSQASYLWAYYSLPSSSVHVKYLGTAFLMGLLASLVWLPLIAYVLWKRTDIPAFQRAMTYFSVSLVISFTGLMLISDKIT